MVMSEKKKYISPFIYSAEMKSSQLLQFSKTGTNQLKQDLTSSQVLDDGVSFGNLSKESGGDESTLW